MSTLKGIGKAKTASSIRRNRAFYPESAVCLNPRCDQTCDYRFEGAGQQPLFCSPNCRVDYGTSRRALLSEVGNLESLIANERSLGRKARELERQLTHARWHLARYGGPPQS